MLKFIVEENLELRLVARKDKDELFSLITENLNYLQQWLGWAKQDSSEKDTIDFIERVRTNYINEDELPLIIVENGRIIGTISLFRIDMVNRSAEIGYWLAENTQGKGIITKCCRAIINYAFAELNLNRIVI
ncbi:MAG: GNAT family N-acetyltransferase, partial [Acidobacteria bacterium]|nr:GNAT family N-acetyltransferase [Acidobacteriota bacterium]